MIPKLIAKFTNSLSVGISTSSTEMILVSTVAKDGQTIPDGTYGFALDLKQDTEEYCIGEYVAGTVTFTKRGLSYLDGFTEVPANKQSHKKGAEVVMTSHPALTYIAKMLAGDVDLDGLLKYPADRVINNQRQLIDKEYADSIVSSQITSLKVSADGALTVAVNDGYYSLNGVITYYAGSAGNAVTDDAVNYIQVNDGALSINTSGFTEGAMPLAKVTAASGEITINEDARAILGWLDIKTSSGIGRDSSGIFIDLATDPGLEFSSGKLKAKVDPTGGLTLGANGLAADEAIRPTTLPAYETLSAGDFLKAINDSGTSKLKKVVGIEALIEQSKSMLTDSFSFISLETNKIAYIRSSGSVLYTAVGSVSGGTITFGSEVSVSSSTGYSKAERRLYEIRKIDSSRYLIVYPNEVGTTAGYVYARVVSVSGTTATLGTETTVETVVGNFDYYTIQLIELEQDKFAVGWSFSTKMFRTAVLTISGTSITIGGIDSNSLTEYDSEGRLVRLSSTAFLWIIPRDSTGYYCYTYVYTVSGDVITRGAVQFPFSFNASISKAIDAVAISSSTVAIFWYAAATLTTLRVTLLSVSGTTVTLKENSLTVARTITNQYAMQLDCLVYNNDVYLAIRDHGRVYKFIADDNTINDTGLSVSFNFFPYGRYLYLAEDRILTCSSNGSTFSHRNFLLDHNEFITSANAAYSADDSVPIVSKFTGFSSLTPGVDYYMNSSATGLSIVSTYQKVGKAINDTTIIK